MRRERVVVALTAGAVIAVLGPGAAADPMLADPILTVDKPAEGAVISRSQSPQIGISGTVAFDTPLQTQGTQRLYLRSEPCSQSARRSLSTVPGAAPEPASCGYIGGWSMNGGVNRLLGYPPPLWEFPSEDGAPLTYDASRPVTGTLVVSSCGDTPDSTVGWLCPDLGDPPPIGLGAGPARVHVTLFGLLRGTGAKEQIAVTTIDYLVTPDRARYTLDFSIPPGVGPERTDYDGLILAVDMEGYAAGHGWLRYRGKSFIEVPVWTPFVPSGVQVAIDDIKDLSTDDVTWNRNGTWSATRPTPPDRGDHTVIVRAFQGDLVTDVTRRITVVT